VRQELKMKGISPPQLIIDRTLIGDRNVAKVASSAKNIRTDTVVVITNKIV